MRPTSSLLLLPALLATLACASPDPDAAALSLASREPNSFPRAWLKGSVVVEQEDGKLFADCGEGSPGASREVCRRWKQLKSLRMPGDEVWYWESPRNVRGDFALGYCLRRGETIVFVAPVTAPRVTAIE